jgi:hypothetical protein
MEEISLKYLNRNYNIFGLTYYEYSPSGDAFEINIKVIIHDVINVFGCSGEEAGELIAHWVGEYEKSIAPVKLEDEEPDYRKVARRYAGTLR